MTPKDVEFPTLYKKTNTGAIQFWEIRVAIVNQGFSLFPEISIRYGQVGTDSPQYTYDLIKEGKNKGKKNETTPWDQAVSEAQAKWEKQKKKGYVESVESAQKEELDELIEGGIEPMLAQSFSKQGHKIKYPCYFQPKFDGIRCIAIIKNGICTLWSRTRKPINSLPHIKAELERMFPNGNIVTDGEAYNHEYKNNFEKIVSLVRQEEPDPDHTLVQYHIYDVASDGTFDQRWNKFVDSMPLKAPTYVFLASTGKCLSEERVMDYFDAARSKGFEGIMLRNADGVYANKRSSDLQKVKEFDDDEFDIIGIEEGRGKLSGHVGAFKCKNSLGVEFLAKMSGETERLRDYFKNPSLWEGKRLTVQYQGLTGREKVPRFPVGIAIRDYE